MSKQDTRIQNAIPVADVEDPKRRELLRKATKLAVYTAPVLFTISQNAFGRSEPTGRTASGKTSPNKVSPGRTVEDCPISCPPPPP
jgi:hypothetical protein